MTATIEIACGEGAEAYKAVLTAGHIKAFYYASRNGSTRGKHGESLVEAFIAAAQYTGKGPVDFGEGLVSVERYRNRLRNNGADGQPAIQEFLDGGSETLYTNGKRNDGPYGEPAYRRFFIGGGIAEIMHYKRDLLDDADNGDPADQKYSVTGPLIAATRYNKGKNDGDLSAEAIARMNRPSKEMMAGRLTFLPGVWVREI